MRPLAIHPWPLRPEDMQLVKDAKAQLQMDEKVMPSAAVPGSPVRVLALGSLPPFVCDAALVKEPSVDAIAEALRWVLLPSTSSATGFMVEDYMSALLGATELQPDPCHCERDVLDWRRRGAEAKACAVCYDAGCHLAEGLCLRD